MKVILLPFLFLSACQLFAADLNGSPSEDTAQVVSALIHQTKESGATFIRNGKNHSAEEAAEHLQKKYEHFLKKGKIKSPEDFITHAGTKSLVSGKYYELKFPDGTTVKSADWLTERLAALRQGNESMTSKGK